MHTQTHTRASTRNFEWASCKHMSNQPPTWTQKHRYTNVGYTHKQRNEKNPNHTLDKTRHLPAVLQLRWTTTMHKKSGKQYIYEGSFRKKNTEHTVFTIKVVDPDLFLNDETTTSDISIFLISNS